MTLEKLRWFIFPVLFIGGAIVVLVRSAILLLRRRRFERDGVRTTGTVIDHVIVKRRKCSVVRFEDRRGHRQTVNSSRFGQSYGVGDHVEVMYLLDEPSKAQVHLTAVEFRKSMVVDTLGALSFIVAAILYSILVEVPE